MAVVGIRNHHRLAIVEAPTVSFVRGGGQGLVSSAGCRGFVVDITNDNPCHEPLNWVAGKELKLSSQNSKTIVFTMYPYYGNSNS